MFVRPLCCLILFGSATLACATPRDGGGDRNNLPDETPLSSWFRTDRADLPAPEEKAFVLPDLAKLTDWRIYPAGPEMAGSRVEIATDSVQVSKEDQIVRYAIAVTPKNGVRNVMFEGLDCDSMRYRLYAFGLSDQRWQKLETVTWRVGLLNTRNVWQGELLKDFCGMTGPYSAEVIIKSLKDQPLPKPRDGNSRE